MTHSQASKSAFTLIELLVYMAIMGFIIVVAGRAFSDSTSMRVRSQNMLKSSEEAGRVSAILKEDISQTGTKVWMGSSTSSGDGIFDYDKDVYINPGNVSNPDFSSYTLIPENGAGPVDQLSFHKAHYNSDGIKTAVVKITWKVENGVLKRSCGIVGNTAMPPELANECGSSSSPLEIEVAENITMFKFLPSKPNSSSSAEVIFPNSGETFKLIRKNSPNSTARIVPTESGVILRDFSLNATGEYKSVEAYLADESGVDDNVNTCKDFKIDFEAGKEYAVDFDLPYIDGCTSCSDAADKRNKILMFQPGLDHLSIGLRKINGNNSELIINTLPDNSKDTLPDFLFYPPQDEFNRAPKNRHFEFSIPKNSDFGNNKICIAITAAFYNDISKQGLLAFENFKVSRKLDKVFHFNWLDLSYGRLCGNSDKCKEKASAKAFGLILEVSKGGETIQDTSVIPIPNNGIIPTGGS